MSDLSFTEDSDQESYHNLKNNIQKIIKLAGEADSPNKKGNKNKHKLTTEQLYKQFIELDEFHKKLPDKIVGIEKNVTKEPKKVIFSSEGRVSSQTSHTSVYKETTENDEESHKKQDNIMESEESSSVSECNEETEQSPTELSSSSTQDESEEEKKPKKSNHTKQNVTDDNSDSVKKPTKKSIVKYNVINEMCNEIRKKEQNQNKKRNCGKKIDKTESKGKNKTLKEAVSSNDSDWSKKDEKLISNKNDLNSKIKKSYTEDPNESEEGEVVKKICDNRASKEKTIVQKTILYRDEWQNTDEKIMSNRDTQSEELSHPGEFTRVKDVSVQSGIELVREEEDAKKMMPPCNKSDDELMIRTTQKESNDENWNKVEDYSITIEDDINYGGYGDGYGNPRLSSLQERMDHLQQQILNLKRQLEVAKQYNERGARDIENMYQRNSTMRSGLEWEEWELKEMVRERMKEKREAAAMDYKTRLKVVDALCSAEICKLEDALETLVPLNAKASSWGTPRPPPESSWMTQDYVLEVVTSMNLSSSEQETVSGQLEDLAKLEKDENRSNEETIKEEPLNEETKPLS